MLIIKKLKLITVLSALFFLLLFPRKTSAQCSAPTWTNNPTGCPGWSGVELVATSYNSSTTEHRWYETQTGGAYFSPSTQGHPDGYTGAWTSKLYGPFSTPKTYWVSAVCNGVESSSRLKVSFGLPASAGITISTNVSPYNRCVGDQITLTASGGSSYSWSTGATGSSITVSPSATTTYSVVGTESTCGTTTNPVYQTVHVGTRVGPVSIAGPSSVCQGTTSNYTVSATNLAYYQLNVSPLSAVSSINNNTGDITWSGSYSGSATVSVTAFSPSPCGATTTPPFPITVSVAAKPTVANAGPDQAHCPRTFTLAANTPSVGVGTWSIVSGSGYFGPGPSTPTTSAIANDRFNALSIFGTYTLQWSISTGGACPVSSDNVTLTVHQPALGANAGDYFIGSSTCGQTQVNLNAGAPTLGTGAWSIESGAGGSLALPSSRVSAFSGTPGNTYVLRWTVSSTHCGSVSDTTKVRFNRYPSAAVANSDLVGLATCGATSVSLSANSPTVGTGQWSIVSGSGGSFGTTGTNVTSTNLQETFRGAYDVNYLLNWTVRNWPCAPSTDPVSVTLNRLPANAPVVGNNERFAPGQLTLTATGANSGEGYEWTVGQSVTTGPTLSVNADESQTNFGTASIKTAVGCKRSSPFNIYVYPDPVITASSPYLYFGSSSTLTTSSYDSYVWSTGANSPSISTSVPGTFSVTVTKGSLTKTSPPFQIKNQLEGVNQNYIQTFIPQKEGIDPLSILAQPVNYVNQDVQYFDGLGRPMQHVNPQGSPLRKDIVTPNIYDVHGREDRKYLPITTGKDGRYKDHASLIGTNKDYTLNFYGQGTIASDDDRPFAKTIFEKSPLNRILKQGAPGLDWQPNESNLSYTVDNDNAVKISYQINGFNEVRRWTAELVLETSPLPIIASTGFYEPQALTITKTKDENDKEVREYFDYEGKLVLKCVQAVATLTGTLDSDFASTYYVYDDFGQLVCVLQPEGTKLIASYLSETTNAGKEAFLRKWSFRYRYDARNRMTLKQVPGADSVRMVYDLRDRLVFSQDGVQRANTAKRWSFTKYDALNRPVMTGEYTHTADITQRQMASLLSATKLNENFDGSTANHGYTNRVLFTEANFPGTFSIHTVNYYDDYAFKTLAAGAFLASEADYKHDHLATPCTPTSVQGTCQFSYNGSNFPRVQGQLTGNKVVVLGSTAFLWSINYYDDKHQLVQTVSSNLLGGVDRSTTIYDFTGKVRQTKTSHRVGSTEHTVVRRFEYDHAGRLEKTWHKIDARPEVILSALEYNELGQLVKKKLHASADNLIDEEGTTYSPGVIEVAQYNNEKNIIANQRVILKPGFSVPLGKSFKASTENQWTSGNSNPLDPSYAQVIDYRYNIRGWITKINDVDLTGNDLFSMSLKYNSTSLGSTYNQYNGNIGEIIWSATGSDKQSYGYKYDPMNRLLEGNYFNLVDGDKNQRYSEHIVGNPALDNRPYDLNGNINGIKRWGKRAEGNFALMDHLAYTYTQTGNQLTRVDDAQPNLEGEEGFTEQAEEAGEYAYDNSGNMTRDKNKGIQTITYNVLNLPHQVKKSDTEYIEYTYDATGRKLRQQVFGTEAKVSDYTGEFFYENEVLKFVNHEEGRALLTTAVPAYEYFLKDQLGNVRVSFKAITEMNEYKTDFEAEQNHTFGNYSAGVHSPMNEFDHTDAGTAFTYSQLLTGGHGSQVGASKSFEVMPGDVFDAEVFGKYRSVAPGQQNSMSTLFSALSTAFNFTVPSGSGLESVQARDKFNAMYGTGSFVGSGDPEQEGAPKAFLNYILFDEAFNMLDFGFDQIDASAAQAVGGAIVPHDHLALHIAVQKKGYLYIFISNESSHERSVYFDDLKIVRHSYIENVSDYYPFGLTFNSYSRENSTAQDYKYNGKEEQNELGLGWLDFGFRMYDPAIAKFTGIDPLASKYHWLTPYNYAENSPVANIDLWGLQRYFAADGSLLGQVGDNTDVRVVNSTMTNQQATEHIQSGSAESTQALTNGSVAFADYFQTVADVTNDAALQTYSNNGNNCFDAATAQLTDAGVTQTGSADAIQTLVNTTADPGLTENAFGGAIRVQTELNAGNPVMVGVKETKTDGTVPDPGNRNSNTGHFVVIRSVTVAADGTVTFNYLDNARASTGKSADNNNFTLNTSTGGMSDTTTPGGRTSYSSYEVSEVRKNN